MIVSRIQEVAEKRDIHSAHQLQLALDISPTGAARLWKGSFTMIGLITLNKLCKVLRCTTADLLKYVPDKR